MTPENNIVNYILCQVHGCQLKNLFSQLILHEHSSRDIKQVLSYQLKTGPEQYHYTVQCAVLYLLQKVTNYTFNYFVRIKENPVLPIHALSVSTLYVNCNNPLT